MDPLTELRNLMLGAAEQSGSTARVDSELDEIEWQAELAEFREEMEAEIRASHRG